MFGKKITYTPSLLKSGEGELLRAHSFTRWMSRDLLQATTDFCRNIGLHAIYAEMNAEALCRYIMWRPPQGMHFEIRSGRSKKEFEEFDVTNAARNWLLLSLHISEKGIYSAVWISAEHYPAAVAVLHYYGIVPAQRKVPE